MDKKILILRKNCNDMFFMGNKIIQKYYFLKENSIIVRIFRKINISLPWIFWGKWKKKIKNFDTIIMFDSGYNKNIPKYIKRKNRNAKIIFWYWNSLVEYNNRLIDKQYIDEIWTYNKLDAINYNLKYNSQFYHKMYELFENEIKYEIIFMGRDKGRKNQIDKMNKDLEEKGIKCNFMIIENEKDYISYKSYLEEVSRAKCILDYQFNDNTGLSLRPLEALFYGKKLITNNKDIINYDFYNPNNIFVLGIDDMDKIKDFIDSPYKEIDEEIINYYEFNSWLQRFFEEEKC